MGLGAPRGQKGTLLDASSKDGPYGNPTIRDGLAMVRPASPLVDELSIREGRNGARSSRLFRDLDLTLTRW